jgi:XTP/dITP diphosphohydrolase
MSKNIKKISSIVIASHNPGKIREMLPFIKKLNTKIYLAKDFKLKEPKEDGSNFIENALKKSRYVNNKTKKISIADDSGLVIPSLQGKPGIFSSRWAGKEKNFDRAMKKVNSLLYKKKTNAYYISVLAISWNKKKEKIFIGKIFGNLIWPPRGNLGFGYDPIFIPKGYNKTFGELSNKIKNNISHRVIAFKKLLNFLN